MGLVSVWADRLIGVTRMAHGYELTSANVWAACSNTMRAARNVGGGEEGRARIQAARSNAQARNDFVAEIISRCAAQDRQ
jgi:hypothetical protein